MKITSVVIALSLLIPMTLTATAASHRSGSRVHSVRSHVTRRGTYVPRHYQTNPNHTKRDNYSTRGNVNPYTGKAGTR